ncbi:MAG: TetR/AcrR family transcriptional regulator C-terminal domain-containing protein [Streptomyces sp.]|uniref:TetR/AcrR family transcriptional regulator C-terminal domain-containing protein n=1 Tax=Streptomyces sp. TaxID=1931 RepID=UPI003D6A110E
MARTHVLQQQAAADSGLSDEDFWTAQVPYLERAMAGGTYPQLAGLDEDAYSMSGEEAMRFGLRPLLDGFEALIDSKKR